VGGTVTGTRAQSLALTTHPRKRPPFAVYLAGESKTMASTEITFDKLVYIDPLKSAGVDEPHARAHAEALDQALRDTVATKQDLREEIRILRDEMRIEIGRLDQKITLLDHKMDVVARDLTIRMGGIAILLFGALASIKFFG